MSRYNFTFPFIFILSITALLFQYFFLHTFYDDNNFLFSYFGDDYNYINNFKYFKISEITSSGLAKDGAILPYNAFLYYTISIGGLPLYYLFECLLFIISNYYFYQISKTFLNTKYRNWALFLYLILPLRYIWLFSYYKDSLILSISIIFIYIFYFKKRRLVGLLVFLPLFLLRPVISLLYLLLEIKFKNFLKLFLITISIFTFLIYLLRDYFYFFRLERILIIKETLEEVPFNETGILNPILPLLLWIITIIQPLFRTTDPNEIWSSINIVVKFDAIIKLVIIPPILFGLLKFKDHLKNYNISIVFKLLCLLSLSLMLSFMFLTNRHFIIFLPWQILFAFYIINKNGYKFIYKIGFFILFSLIILNNI